MRVLVFTLALALTACAGHDETPCPMLPSAAPVVWPDGVTRKSNLYTCDHRSWRVESVNDASQFFITFTQPNIAETPQ